jgi:tRNA pseudouridine55 synthase
VLLIDKPRGWTSFDVVNRVRHTLGVKKVGHAGSLDPLATGLLVVCTGDKTRELHRFQEMEKEYRVVMRLGGRTPSFDAETPVVEQKDWQQVDSDQIRSTVARFVGAQIQVPPLFSAVKVRGRRLYKYARKGAKVERPPREVFISLITVESVDLPDVYMTVVCSKGTYIRSLVDDIGSRLGCGAYVVSLKRTRIGDFRIEDAMSVESSEPSRRSP